MSCIQSFFAVENSVTELNVQNNKLYCQKYKKLQKPLFMKHMQMQTCTQVKRKNSVYFHVRIIHVHLSVRNHVQRN